MIKSTEIPKCCIAIQGSSQQRNGFGIPRPQQLLNVELDVEKRLQAVVLKDRVRIKQFFIDFDRLRKGTVGEAAVSSIDEISMLMIVV